MDLSSIYTELIMEHNKSHHNRRSLESYDDEERGHNPSCGDDITLQIQYEGDIIKDAAFQGDGCAISQASTSIMIDLIKGKTIQEAYKTVETFLAMIKKEITMEEAEALIGDAAILSNISNMPARVKCAVLAWHTLGEVLKRKDEL